MFWVLFAIFLLACLAAGSTGALFPPGTWYEGLARPSFTPPRWAFPVAWNSIYVLTALAAARVAGLPGAGLALALFALQVALNTLWTPVFFGLHRPGLALVVLAGLWGTVAAMGVAFWRLDGWAGVMILPYLAWLTLAGALNAAIWRLNPGAG